MFMLMDGKATANEIKQQIKEQTDRMARKPVLKIILVGDNPASAVYVKNKIKDCQEVGIEAQLVHFDSHVPQKNVEYAIEAANRDENVNGIIVQLPLPKHMNEHELLNLVSPKKDVDCLTDINIGRLFTGKAYVKPCTPQGIIQLLNHYGVYLSGKKAVVIGRSNIVGKPMAMLLMERNATVTVCHTKTPNIADYTKDADIIVVATGHRNTLTANMVKAGCVVVDVGMNRDENGKLCGDVDFNNLVKKVGYITPVPGGVGPMTRAVLLENVMKLSLGLDKSSYL